MRQGSTTPRERRGAEATRKSQRLGRTLALSTSGGLRAALGVAERIESHSEAMVARLHGWNRLCSLQKQSAFTNTWARQLMI